MIAAEVLEEDKTAFVVGEVPDPVPGPDDVVVQVAATGLAYGNFSLLALGRIPLFPVVLGHEIAGTVASVGERVDPELVGRRVRVHPLLGCGTCEYCVSDREQMCSANSMIGQAVFGPDAMPLYSRYHRGGLAQQVLVPATNIDPLPEAIGFDLGAKVHDFANAVRALKLAALPPGSTLGITAVTGAMGTATILLARHFGVRRVVAMGRDAERLDAVRALDPDLVATVHVTAEDSPEQVVGRVRAIEPAGMHAVVDYLPEGPGIAKAFGGIRYGGRIVHMGVNPSPFPIPMAALSISCISLVGTRNATRADALDAMRIIERDPDRYERLITHRFPLDRIGEVREMMMSRPEPMWMAVVHPPA